MTTSDRGTGLPEVIAEHARDPERVALVLPSLGDEHITYAKLWERSGRAAAALVARGVRRADRVAVGMATRWEVIAAVIAVHRLGCTLIPLHDAPTVAAGDTRHAAVFSALRAGRARWCVVGAGGAASYETALAGEGIAAATISVEELFSEEVQCEAPEGWGLKDDDPMLIQFSSGSTSTPKGVCLTRANVNANVHAIKERLRGSADEVTVSWLPLYHDMGLIGALFTSLNAGAKLVLLRPQDFVRNPLGWLEAVSRHRGTVTMGPQFGYSLCVTRSQGAVAWEKLKQLDLSSLKMAMNGSETVSWEQSRRFQERFEQIGLRPHVLQPAYGLAENCVAVTIRDPLTPVPVRRLNRASLAEGRLEMVESTVGAGSMEGDSVEGDEAGVQTTVGTGVPITGTRISVRDDEGREAGPGEVGQIYIAGACATAFYCVGDGELRPAGDGQWVPTGDLGAVIDGELHVIGRVKEIIKCGGRTFVPSDIEAALSRRLSDDLAGVAAFGFYDAAAGGEQLVVVAETPKGMKDDGKQALPERIRLCVLQEFQLPVRDVVLVPARAIPKTSSGKIQRVRLQHAYATGGIPELVGV